MQECGSSTHESAAVAGMYVYVTRKVVRPVGQVCTVVSSVFHVLLPSLFSPPHTGCHLVRLYCKRCRDISYMRGTRVSAAGPSNPKHLEREIFGCARPQKTKRKSTGIGDIQSRFQLRGCQCAHGIIPRSPKRCEECCFFSDAVIGISQSYCNQHRAREYFTIITLA